MEKIQDFYRENHSENHQESHKETARIAACGCQFFSKNEYSRLNSKFY